MSWKMEPPNKCTIFYRSSRSVVFYEKGVLKNFAKFTTKHLCWSLFFIKTTGVMPGTISKKEAPTHVFSCEFYEFIKNTFFIEHPWWLLLSLPLNWLGPNSSTIFITTSSKLTIKLINLNF